MENTMNTLSEIIAGLREKYHLCDFKIDSGAIVCKDTNESFLPDDLVIEKIYRFEGDSDPSDMSILYEIRSRTGTHGILIDAYGAYSNTEISDLINKVPVKLRN